ncbi:MAG TPA: glycosyltransferase family 2 protein [Aquabacterium sp.]|nr:glycosyltransferase family 2 protein [Aquabacterium sp.]
MDPKVSVLILTKNEEQDLPGCLQSVAWSDDVHVLDSGSTDRTQAIAREFGATVTERPFDGYARQRNFGLKLPFKHEWVFILDADERVPLQLVQELSGFVSSAPANTAAARIRRRDIWWGRWLKHAQISPFYIRLARVGKTHYEREVNEVMVVDGEIADLQNHFDHYPFSKGLDHWITKHNVYSKMEAQVIADGDIHPSLKTALFDADFNNRRLHQKAIFYKLPGRPFIKLMYMLIVRRAFLDGWPGIRYSILQAIYEYFIVLKTKEIIEKRTGAA